MILITGAAGFIGSVLVSELNKKGIKDLILVDHFRDGQKWLNLRGLKFKQFIILEDFLQQDLFKHYTRLQGIFHLGACSATTQTDMDFLYRNNFLFSQRLFDLAAYGNIPFFYASSAATYGAGEKGYSDDHDLIGQLRPLNPYGYSKQLFDMHVLDSGNQPSQWAGFKFFNVYGPNEYHKASMTSVVYQAFQQIQQSGEVKLFESHRSEYQHGEQQRDFVYVKDVVRAMIEFYENPKDGMSGIYNMGTGQARTFKDLVLATYQAMGKEPKINFVPMPENIRNQYQYYTCAEMSKFHNAIENFEFHTLEDGVRDYVQNYLQSEITPYCDLNWDR